MDISNNYWRYYWGNIRETIGLLNKCGSGIFEKLKYMKEINEKPSIYNRIGIEDY